MERTVGQWAGGYKKKKRAKTARRTPAVSRKRGVEISQLSRSGETSDLARISYAKEYLICGDAHLHWGENTYLP